MSDADEEDPLPAMQNIAGLLFDMGGIVFEIDFQRALRTWVWGLGAGSGLVFSPTYGELLLG